MRLRQIGIASLAIGGIVVSCGSRTGLPGDTGFEIEVDAQITLESGADARDGADVRDVRNEDAPFDAPLIEGGPLDADADCDAAPECNPNDLGFIYRCGVPIFQCSSLEQCKDAKCVNPCKDTLGQDTTNGCEFYSVEADTVPEAEGVCFAAFVVNQWPTGEPARIEVSRNGAVLPIAQFARVPTGTGTGITYAPYSATAGLAKDQVAILFLSRDPAAENDQDPSAPRRLAGCPAGVTPAVVGDAAMHGTGLGSAFRIKTNVPVVAYQMLPYGAGRARVTGATLLLPTNVWDQNYVLANAYRSPAIAEPRVGPTLAVVAQEDNTHVTIKPTTAILPGTGVAGSPANVPVTYTLASGQYVQFTQDLELTGSALQSDKPVAVIGGSTLMQLPIGRNRADGAHQMLPPVHALGSEYAAVRYKGRRRPTGGTEFEAVPWRIVGVVDGTQLTYDPPQPAAPTFLNARQLQEFDATGPFVVRSQDAAHPFYMAQYMTGSGDLNTPFGGDTIGGDGDPEFVNVVPPRQYLPRFTFFTDPTYPETSLVVVRQKVTGDFGPVFPDVTLDCAGQLVGWLPIGSGKFEYTRVDLSTGDFQGVGGCDNGVHVIRATIGGFDTLDPAIGVTIWGWGNNITYAPDNLGSDEANPKFTRWVSYAYPAGANMSKLNDVVLSAQ